MILLENSLWEAIFFSVTQKSPSPPNRGASYPNYLGTRAREKQEAAGFAVQRQQIWPYARVCSAPQKGTGGGIDW